MDNESHIAEVKMIYNSMNTTLKEELKNYHEWYEHILPKMNFLLQCKELYEVRSNEAKLKVEESRTKKEQLEMIIEEKSQLLSELQKEYKSILDESKIYKNDYEIQDRMLKEVIKQTELSRKDKDILNVTRQKYETYKEISNIIWDYSIPLTDMAAGYVRNKSKEYIHWFEFKKSEITHPELVENVWKEIEMAVQEDWTDIIEMTEKPTTNVSENTPQNS